MSKRLTPEQQDLVTNNHNLIYAYCRKHNLDCDEWYCVLAESLCKAAMIYDSSVSKFSTFAFFVMKRDVRCCIRDANAQKRIPAQVLLYLEQPLVEAKTSGACLKDLIPDPETLYGDPGKLVVITDFCNHLEPQEKILLDLVNQGMRQADIAVYLNISQAQVSRRISKLKAKWAKYTK
jgi:RNA polymerase sigma factor (sigma-70 family)